MFKISSAKTVLLNCCLIVKCIYKFVRQTADELYVSDIQHAKGSCWLSHNSRGNISIMLNLQILESFVARGISSRFVARKLSYAPDAKHGGVQKMTTQGPQIKYQYQGAHNDPNAIKSSLLLLLLICYDFYLCIKLDDIPVSRWVVQVSVHVSGHLRPETEVASLSQSYLGLLQMTCHRHSIHYIFVFCHF